MNEYPTDAERRDEQDGDEVEEQSVSSAGEPDEGAAAESPDNRLGASQETGSEPKQPSTVTKEDATYSPAPDTAEPGSASAPDVDSEEHSTSAANREPTDATSAGAPEAGSTIEEDTATGDSVSATDERPTAENTDGPSETSGPRDHEQADASTSIENDTTHEGEVDEADRAAESPDDSAPNGEESHDEGESHGEEQHSTDGEPHRPRIILKAGTDPDSIKALELCREKVAQLHLKMHPLAARWDGDKHVTIFFRADEKVDFRKLVRELSRVLRARIELRQLGPREQGKLCGLVGKCGQPLCCQTFLGEFTQSSIKMAKTQDLALNPMKISGVCGRLLCCLNYEQEMYAEVKSRMPKVNKWVETEFGPGRVTALNVLKETVTVHLETTTRELPLDQVRISEAPPQS